MAMAHSNGQMVENTLETTMKIKREATVSLHGRMADATEENGSTANSMEKEHT